MSNTNTGSLIFIVVTVLVGLSVWRMLSKNRDVRQQELAGLLGGVHIGIEAPDIINYINLMGWDRVEAATRLAHAQTMVRPLFGPKQHKASLVLYRRVLDQIGKAPRSEQRSTSMDEKFNVGAPQPPPTDTIQVRGSDWRIINGTLRRDFSYHGLPGRHYALRLQFDIDRSEGLLRGTFDYHFHMILMPHPWPNEGEGFLVAHLGPQHETISCPTAQVRCARCDDGSLLIGTVDQVGTNAMLSAIVQCTPMRLLLTGQSGTLLELPVPNDDSFARASADFFY